MKPETTSRCADPTYSTRPEGFAAYGSIDYEACPYIRGEDRWAWQQGWREAWSKDLDKAQAILGTVQFND